MKKRTLNIDITEAKSIRYLNLFRMLLSFFFFSIIFEKIGGFVGYFYTENMAKLIAIIYLSYSILIWVSSLVFKKHNRKIGLIALVLDLPMIISLTLLFDGLDKGWAILPVITIGSFAMLSRRSYAIFAMPICATILLWLIPKIMGINFGTESSANILLYAMTYFAIALVGIRQSQKYNQTLKLSQKQKSKISSLSNVNQLVIDQMRSGVVAYDKDYQIILLNKKAKELLKLSSKSKLPIKLIKKIIATPKSSHNSTTYNGEDLLIHTAQNNKADLNLLFVEEQKQINEKSQLINLATLGQLSATIAHELRNPLAAIYSAAQLVQESETITLEDKELINIIINQAERSNRIIEDILLMSKTHIANQKEINISDKIKSFKREFCLQNKIDLNCIKLKNLEDSTMIQFDPNHLHQICWNLAENAIKHGDNNKLSIEINNQEKYLMVDFTNDGKAFESIIEESLFTPFFTTHTQGTGLGLYICREICKSNNAKLEYLRPEFQHVFRIHILK